MKLLVASYHRRSGQIMAEACIGLALMVFAWIIITFSLFMANNQIRTEMAARYAAWYAGNNNGTAPSTANIDQYFFFQSGLSTVYEYPHAADVVDALSGQAPPPNFANTNGSNDKVFGPFKVQVTFGVTDANNSTNPFPFNMLRTHVPFMTNSMMSVFSVNSTCQWDGDSDTWSSWTDAAKGVWNMLSSNVKSLFSL
jgi:hypothetical protein